MRLTSTRILVPLVLFTLCSCSDGGGTTGDGGVQEDGSSTSDAQHDGGPPPDGGAGGQGLGASCTCTGAACEQMGVPKPASGTIAGCEQVATDIPGAALSCLRSYDGVFAPATFFANGYCGLMATRCTGAALICDSAVFGDYDTMTTCPAGSVMMTDSQAVDVVGNQATVDNKVCVKACAGDGDCRTGETDPVLANEASQYQCIDKGGVKFCYDPRNLSANYTATAF